MLDIIRLVLESDMQACYNAGCSTHEIGLRELSPEAMFLARLPTERADSLDSLIHSFRKRCRTPERRVRTAVLAHCGLRDHLLNRIYIEHIQELLLKP
jgi:hypothetical protein